MPDFNSPNIRRNMPQPPAQSKQQPSQQPLREFNVGLPEDMETQQAAPAGPQMQQISPAEYEARIKSLRQEKAEVIKHGPKITDHGKRRIELLANIGRLTRDVQIDDKTFSMRTLKSYELRESTMGTLEKIKYDAEASFESRKQQLARSIFKIDGDDIDVVLGSSDIESKLELFDLMEEVVVSRLWDEYAAMREEAKTKYGINSAKEAQEVAEDLKK